MSDEKSQDSQTAEALALLQDLEAYANPQAYADPNEPHVYRLNIPGKPYDEKAAVLRIELDGAQLKSSLRALMSVAMNHLSLSEEDRKKYLASEPYQQSENDMYVFFLRHFPKLITDFFITISQIALVSPGSVGSMTFSGDARKEFERNQKNLLEVNLGRLRKKIKQMLETNPRGRPKKIIDPNVAPPFVNEVVLIARELMGGKTGKDALPALKTIADKVILTENALGKRLREAGYSWTQIKESLLTTDPPKNPTE